jgi:DNA ligase-1
MSRFSDLAQLADQLAAEPSRLKKRAAIATAIRTIVGLNTAESVSHHHGEAISPSAQDLENAGLFCLYLAGQPFPEADPRKLNAGGALLTRALKQVSHCTDATLTAAYRRHGDLGAAAHDVLLTHAPTTPTLTLDELANAFDAMATARTTAVRSATLIDILHRATALEAKYLLKLMLGDMRIGVKQSLIEEAIAAAANPGTPRLAQTSGDPHLASVVTPAEVRHAVMLEANLARAVTLAFTHTLSDARMRLFHPLGFMLASPVETPEEAIERFTPKPPKPEKPKSIKKTRRKKSDPTPEPEDPNEFFPDLTPTDSLEPADNSAFEPANQPVFPEGAGGFSPLNNASTEGALAPGLPSNPQLPPSDNHAEGLPPSAQDAYLEDKYDGMRAQLHCGDPSQPGRVALYSRNREDITQSFPEIAEAFSNVTNPIILDGEILGWDLATNRALPFSILGQRIGRKKVEEDLRRQIPVIFMAFDLLYADGQLLLDLPLRERRQRLEKLAAELTPTTTSTIEVPETTNQPQLTMFDTTNRTTETAVLRLFLSPAQLVTTAEAIDQAYTDARARSNEGVMLKSAESTYQPGRRGLAWVKLKRELATLDVVITGAEYGHGKRAGLLSDYTFAIQNKTGDLLNVGKAYSGVTDAEILELTTWLKSHTLEDHGHFRTVEPLRIIEVAFNNIMRSPRHSSGFALRFPRILRLRDDKPLTEIDTLARVEEIYQSQPDRPTEEAL